MLGDSITTDHISPAGAIKSDSPAGKYLSERQIRQKCYFLLNLYFCKFSQICHLSNKYLSLSTGFAGQKSVLYFCPANFNLSTISCRQNICWTIF